MGLYGSKAKEVTSGEINISLPTEVWLQALVSYYDSVFYFMEEN